MPDPADLEPEKLGRYELLFRLARGGMSELYVGKLEGLQGFEKLVAIKLINAEHAEESSFTEMFIDEARLAARIVHPNVVQVLELERSEGAYYIVMEYVHGESLNALIKHGQLSLPLAARVLADAAAGLHCAHELRGTDGRLLQVVHRDVSPSNILISYAGVVKVSDFGVARALTNLNVTKVGHVKGKFAYMAPEYLVDQRADRRCDVFALGAVLYEATTSRRLYPTLEDRGGTVVPPSLIVDNYPDALEQIVLKAIREDPDLRYQTAQELQQALEEFIVETGTPALNSGLGKVMRATFAGRMERKEGLLAGRGDAAALAGIIEEETRSSTLHGQTVSQPSASFLQRWNQRPRLLLASGLLMAAAVSLLIIYLLIPERAEPEPARPARGPTARNPDRGPDTRPARDLRARRGPDRAASPDAGGPADAAVEAASGAPGTTPIARQPLSPAAAKLPPAVPRRPRKAPAVRVEDRPSPKRSPGPKRPPPKPAAPAEPADDLFGSPFKSR